MTRQRTHRRRQRGVAATAPEPRGPYITRRLAPYNVLSEEGLSLIEANADQILSETGMEFREDPEVLDIFRAAGCDVDGERVRFAPGFCRKTIQATAPARFMQHARNPENSVQIGGDASVLCPSWGPPFVHDLERGRRYATYEDFERLVKLHREGPERAESTSCPYQLEGRGSPQS